MKSLHPHFIKLNILALMIGLLAACSGGSIRSSATNPNLETAMLDTTPKAPNPLVEREFKAGLLAFKTGDQKSAERIFTAMTEEHPEYASPYANLGMILTQKGDYKNAERAFKKAIAINKSNPEVYNHLGILYRNMGQFELAQQAYLDGLKIAPDYPNLVFNIGILYDLYLDQKDEALKHFQHYSKLVPNDEQVTLWIADINQRVDARY